MDELTRNKIEKLYKGDGFRVECITESWDELDDEDKEAILEGVDDPVCGRCGCGCAIAERAMEMGCHPADII